MVETISVAYLARLHWLMVAILSAALGAPVGIPPGEEDPGLLAVAPEECFFFGCWVAPEKPDAQSTNKTEQLLADPEVSSCVKEVRRRVLAALRQGAIEEGDARSVELATVLPRLFEAVLSHGAAVYVAPASEEGGTVEAALVVQLGDDLQATRSLVQRFLGQFPELEVARSTVEGMECWQASPAGTDLIIHWAWKDTYLIAGIGDETVQQASHRLDGAPPAWLTRLREQLAVPRFSSLTHIRIEPLLPLLTAELSDREAALFNATGIDSLVELTGVSGMDDQACISRWRLEWQDSSPLASMFAGPSLREEDLRGLPADALVALAMRLDGSRVLEETIKVVQRADVRAAGEIEEALEDLRRGLGMDVRQDLLAAVGDVWYLSTSPGSGGIAAGWVASVNVRDHERLSTTMNRFMGFAQATLALSHEQPQINETVFGGETIYYLSVPDDDFPVAPAWCLTNDRFYLALFPQAIRWQLRGRDRADTLADRPDVRALFREGKSPRMIVSKDLASLFELTYPFTQLVARAGSGNLQRKGYDVDISLLPSTGAITSHLAPATGACYVDDTGLELEFHQPLPLDRLMITAPITALLLSSQPPEQLFEKPAHEPAETP